MANWKNEEVLGMVDVLRGVKHHTLEYNTQFHYSVSEIHTVFSHCGVIYNRYLCPFTDDEVCSKHYVSEPNSYITVKEIQHWLNHIESIYIMNMEEEKAVNYIYFHNNYTVKMWYCHCAKKVVLQLLKGNEVIDIILVKSDY
jgi:hypothetical protein